MRKNRERYFSAIEDVAGGKGRIYEITELDAVFPVVISVYDDLPEPGELTAFSFGLSSASHSEWKYGRPELMISLKTCDHAWPICMGEIVKNYRQEALFGLGNILNFRQNISDESDMTSFLVFSCSLLESKDQQIVLDDYVINLLQLYPIYEQESELVDTMGVEAFFWELGIDFSNPKRPPAGLKGAH